MRYGKRESSYMTMYVPKDTSQSFRDHCLSRGLSMSGTITILIEEYLKKEKKNA